VIEVLHGYIYFIWVFRLPKVMDEDEFMHKLVKSHPWISKKLISPILAFEPLIGL
jgi:hypothetical protein